MAARNTHQPLVVDDDNRPVMLSDVGISRDLVISVLSLVFSILFNAYFQFFRGPSLKLYVGHHMKISRTSRDGFACYLNLVLSNVGAHAGAVHNLKGTISRGGDRPEELFWYSFAETKEVGEIGTRFQPFDEFKGWPAPIVVPARETVEKRVHLQSRNAFSLSQGNYHLQLQLFRTEGPKPFCTQEFRFNLDEEKATRFKEIKVDPATGISKGAVFCDLVGASGVSQ